MACNYYIKKGVKSGMTPIFVRIRSRLLKVDIKLSTNLEVDARRWNAAAEKASTLANFRKSEDGKPLFAKLDQIETLIEGRLNEKEALSSEKARLIIDSVTYQEAIEAKKKEEEEKARKEAASKRMTLNKFIAKYKEEVKNGGRQTEQGKNYSPSSVKAIKGALQQFENFQSEMGRTYDFKDIDMNFYYAYTAYLKNKDYSINSIGKCIKILKGVLAAAESEGYHSNAIFKDRRFKGARVDIDSIYLTREELDKMMAVDMSKLSPGHEQARDIFMVGVWTAQRVSDYNNIKKKDFSTITKNVMKEKPDPKNKKKKIAWIEQQEITYLNIRQQKTGAKVSIPCNSQLKAILEKYNYQMPHLEDQVINRYIKEVAEQAGLTDLVEIETTKGGTPKKEKFPKYKLIHTHTARRTGATLMYLAGMDVYDIMKVTGHSSPAMLKKYIRADSLDVVEKLTDKYDYFN
ncbi:MAG: tyrosine-type recombinase/integrase [Bacteroidales bacterium]|nr:tyrosine-type recombinase/integrase [Bacteroidales bacterium]